MSLEKIIAATVGVLVLLAIPAVIIFGIWSACTTKASDRPSHTSTAAAFLSALDRIVRPSAEHQIEEENRVVKEEDDVGGGKDA